MNPCQFRTDLCDITLQFKASLSKPSTQQRCAQRDYCRQHSTLSCSTDSAPNMATSDVAAVGDRPASSCIRPARKPAFTIICDIARKKKMVNNGRFARATSAAGMLTSSAVWRCVLCV